MQLEGGDAATTEWRAGTRSLTSSPPHRSACCTSSCSKSSSRRFLNYRRSDLLCLKAHLRRVEHQRERESYGPGQLRRTNKQLMWLANHSVIPSTLLSVFSRRCSDPASPPVCERTCRTSSTRQVPSTLRCLGARLSKPDASDRPGILRVGPRRRRYASRLLVTAASVPLFSRFPTGPDDSVSHSKSSLVGVSVQIPIQKGRLDRKSVV